VLSHNWLHIRRASAYKENSAPAISKGSALAVFVRPGLTWNNLQKGKLIKQKIAAAEASA